MPRSPLPDPDAVVYLYQLNASLAQVQLLIARIDRGLRDGIGHDALYEHLLALWAIHRAVRMAYAPLTAAALQRAADALLEALILATAATIRDAATFTQARANLDEESMIFALAMARFARATGLAA